MQKNLILSNLMNYRLFILFFSLLVLSSNSFADSATPKSTYDWTGVYVGGFVGGASGANATTSTNSYLSPSGGSYDGYNATGSSNYSTSSSFIGGGTVGYNWQIPKTPYLIGLEGEYGYLGMSGSGQSQAVTSGDPFSYNTQSKTRIGSDYGYGLVGGRLGYALDRSLFYVKSGAVFTQVNSSSSTLPIHGDGSMDTFTSSSTKSGGTTTGYAIGGGIEYAPSWYSNENLTVKVEYLYFGIPSSSNSNASSCSNYIPPCEPMANTTYHNSTGGISTAKIGVNYKF